MIKASAIASSGFFCSLRSGLVLIFILYLCSLYKESAISSSGSRLHLVSLIYHLKWFLTFLIPILLRGTANCFFEKTIKVMLVTEPDLGGDFMHFTRRTEQ